MVTYARISMAQSERLPSLGFGKSRPRASVDPMSLLVNVIEVGGHVLQQAY